jgi:hypothetical protein
LFIVDSKLIEKARSEVTEQQLIENAKQLNDKVTRSNLDLILNVDETTLDSKKDFDKIKVVSTRECLRSYWSVRGESHITFMPTVVITG